MVCEVLDEVEREVRESVSAIGGYVMLGSITISVGKSQVSEFVMYVCTM